MKTKLVPGWLRRTSQIALAVPMLGLFTQSVGSDYFMQYLADVFISVFQSFGTALIHLVVQTFLYGGA